MIKETKVTDADMSKILDDQIQKYWTSIVVSLLLLLLAVFVYIHDEYAYILSIFIISITTFNICTAYATYRILMKVKKDDVP